MYFVLHKTTLFSQYNLQTPRYRWGYYGPPGLSVPGPPKILIVEPVGGQDRASCYTVYLLL